MVLRENYLRWSYKVKFTEFKVVNVLAVCTMPFEIRLPKFTKSNRPLASYEPELHPAALYRIKDIKATLQVFSTGSITVTDQETSLLDSPQQYLIHFPDGNSVPSTSNADFYQQPDLPSASGQAAAPPSSPVMVTVSSQHSNQETQQKQIPPFSFINNIFKDMKSFIHPFTVSIASINTRLNDTDKQVTFNAAAISIKPSIRHFVMAAVSVQHFRSPQLTFPLTAWHQLASMVHSMRL
ncbi:UNVERIFIED_CONTAM: hypothetical protein FKN15_057436 [Acipenser sinensis]